MANCQRIEVARVGEYWMRVHQEFVAKLEQRGTGYTVRRIDTATCIEVGRFCYRFNGEGQSRDGWITNCAADRRSEWQKWAALLNEPLAFERSSTPRATWSPLRRPATFRAEQQMESWATAAMEDSQHFIAKDQEVFEFL